MQILKNLLLIICCLFFSCKPTQDNSIDDKPYFQISDPTLQQALQTRLDKCNAVPNQQFNSQTEECVQVITQAKSECEKKRFYQWDPKKNQCVYQQDLVDLYTQSHCTPKGKIFMDGQCIDPPVKVVQGSATATSTSSQTVVTTETSTQTETSIETHTDTHSGTETEETTGTESTVVHP